MPSRICVLCLRDTKAWAALAAAAGAGGGVASTTGGSRRAATRKTIATVEEEAVAAESYTVPPGAMGKAKGDVEAAFAAAEAGDGVTVEGSLKLPGQSHFSMEKHTAVAVPQEQGRMLL